MPATPSPVRSLQGQSAAALRWDLPNKDDLARDYAAARLAQYIQRVVDAAPPLTAEQRDRLAVLLRPVDRRDDVQVGGPDAAA